jgi:hypothetical protein
MTRTREHPHQVKSPTPVGTVVDGYRIERLISARADLHTVVEATDASGQRVTLKLLAKPPEGKELRRRAAKLKARRASLQHPHMLPIVLGHDNRQRICLEGVPANAVTLADKLRDGPLEPEHAVALMSQVAGALETARRRGLIHRELTPTSIIVAGDESPKALLTDFGLAAPDAPACKLPAAVEEADYRSPEEIRGAAPSTESNVYSLACVLVECLTGAPPYPYDRPLLALHAHLSEPPPRPSERNPELAPELDEVVARALNKEAARRFRSPGAFMGAVQRALGIDARIPVTGGTEERREVARADNVITRPERRAPAAPMRDPAAAAAAALEQPETTAPAPVRPSVAAATPATRKPPRRARRERPARTHGLFAGRRLTPVWVGVALLASALAGFATGSDDGGEAGAPATVVPTRDAAPQTPVTVKPTVGPVVSRLDQRRTAARRQLRAAKLPAAQAKLATRLAGVYADARAALLKAPGEIGSRQRLADQLTSVEAAYRELARAAKQNSGRAWRAASAQVSRRERDLELLLRTQRWI